jgi:hypothetical protein
MKHSENRKCEYVASVIEADTRRSQLCAEHINANSIPDMSPNECLTPTREEAFMLSHFKVKPEDREEILRRHRKDNCGRFALRGANKHEAKFMRGSCKCWDCPYCGPKKAGRYKRAIQDNAQHFKLRRFLTLTLDPKKLPEGVDAVEHLRTSFNKLRTYLRRKFGEKISYICVLEFQKPKENNPGLPHLHILVDRYIEQSWIKQAWSTLGGGEHVDIRFVDLHRVSRYLSKYLTKEMLMDAPKKSRRVTTSRNISLNQKQPSEYSWVKLNTTIALLRKRYEGRCFDEVSDSDGGVLSFKIQYSDPGGWEPKPRVRFTSSSFEFRG